MWTSTIRVPTTPVENQNQNQNQRLFSSRGRRRSTCLKVSEESYSFSVESNTNRLVVANSGYIEQQQHMVVVDDDDEPPLLVQLLPICSESQFDLIISDAHHPLLLIVWMASWCRKCIYLKPKLEKLAAHYYPRLRFYCVNVNAVPHKLISRAGVTKMPTIQLWKDGKQHSEIIGGHKGHLVVNEVREMIESEKNI